MKALIALALLLSSAHAFEIRTTLSSPCHEKITLAAFGVIGPPFGDGENAASLPTLVARARGVELPADKGTRGFVKDLAGRYGFSDRDPVERWVLASIVAGARAPDTRGFGIVAINETRVTHIDDDMQAAHALRRSTHNGLEGNRSAIAEARAYIVAKAEAAHDEWWNAPIRDTRWTFPFYGEQTVKTFGPAYHLGVMAHTTQDSYTHTIRDETFQILSVLNFAEAAVGHHKEHRDGMPHSSRMDHCKIDKSFFDRIRVHAARDASIDVAQAAIDSFEAEDTRPTEALSAPLDQIFAYRDGCDSTNDYCDSPWVVEARKGATEPIDAWFCAATNSGPPPWFWALGLLAGFTLRRRRGAH